MRQLRWLAALLLVCSLAHAQERPLAVGAKAPDFVLADLAGKWHRLSRGYGTRVTVVALSRVPSPANAGLMRELEKLQQRFHGDRVGIILVSLGGEQAREATSAAVKRWDLTYPVLLEDEFGMPQPYRVTAAPHLLVVDQDGLIRFSHSGYDVNVPAKLAAEVEANRPPGLLRLLDLEGLGCATCKPMPPLLRSVQQELAGKVRIDVWDYDPDLIEEYGLEIMPTQIFYDADGKEVFRHGGLMTRAEVLEQFRKMGVATE
jgi:thioredoxin 1